MTYPQGQDQDQ